MPGSDLRRKWLAIALATLVMSTSYWFIVYGAVAGATDDGPPSTPPFALGLALVPFAFMALAFLSRKDDAPWATFTAMGLFLVVGLPIGLFNPVIGLVAGFGMGGAVTLRTEQGIPWRRPRALGVLAAVVYTAFILLIAPGFGVLTGSVVPFAASGIADQVVEGRMASSGTSPASSE